MMENIGIKAPSGLRPGISPLGIWSLSIGTSIGWGSFIVTCNSYLQKAGILGTIFGLLVGMAVILVITWNLQYMIRVSPDAGGVYTFQNKVSGKDMGFLALWFTLLTYMAILWANMTSVPLFARFFLGRLFQFGFHYSIFGYEVWFGEALLSICAVVLVGLLCAKSARLTFRVVVAAVLVFGAGFALCAVFALLRHDPSFSFAPMYAEGTPAFSQIIRIAAISPWAFIGFENISHFSEEYAFPVKRVRRILIWSVILTTLLYLLVSLLSVSAYPPEYDSWMAYIRDMGNLEGIKAVPAFYAANHYLGQAGVVILMFALFGVILTSLIGNMLALSRLLYAAGREGEAPQVLSGLSPKGIPDRAILAIVAVSCLIPFLGRTAIGWIVDVTTLGATLMYGLVSFGVYRHARAAGKGREVVLGILGCALMLIFVLLLLIPGLLSFEAMATESYVLFIFWAVLGLGYFRILISRENHREYEQHVVVWVILLVLIVFASVMWVSRATEQAANDAVGRIYLYHQSHPDHDRAGAEEERVNFLQQQARQISSTNMMYSVMSLGLFFLCFIIMMNNYRQTQKLGKRLTDAEEAARSARKIAELKASLDALLNNMPALTFTKDARTGVYLACNQAFAEYAHKDTPDGVVGLTDAQIFDTETARHFVQDDRIALSMETPYIFFEDVLDAAGSERQFQTTKIKYRDDTGRLCVLGMCQDVTDMIRIQHENAMTKEAYESAVSAGQMYTHIAQTLARDYTDLFYINSDSEEYIEYQRESISNSLSKKQRGLYFFSEGIEALAATVVPDDREAFLQAMNRRTLMKALEDNPTLIMTYRMMSEGAPAYIRMKVSSMADDEHFIIIGMTNVDAEMRDAMAKREALADALSEAKKASEAKTAFLSNMSHEIRTPMNAIIGLNTLALKKDSLDADTRDYLEKIGGSARHLLDLINDILDMSRIESGKVVLHSDKFSFGSILEQINAMFLSQCREKGLTYECRTLGRLDGEYIGDEMKLKEVLINILSNAVKFTASPGNITLTVEQTALYEDQATIHFRVRDTGIGMDREFIPRIFEAFTQEDGTHKSRYGSTGLGMAITKRIVEMMNGSIRVESQKGVGTEFDVAITLRRCDQQEDDRNQEIDLRNLTVLVVDDNPIDAAHARVVLEDVGIRADTASGGEEALRMIEVQHSRQQPYSLVLLDWDMSEMNGPELSQEIRRRYGSENTVVVMTAYNWEDIQEEAHRAGVDSFLAKPLFASSVSGQIGRIARQHRMNQSGEKKRADLSGRLILLAEDMELNAEIVRNILSFEGMKADHAENGKIAVEMFEKSSPGAYSAILMDVRMPVMDGLEAATAIRALQRPDARRIPIIALTANAFNEDVQLSLQAGMSAHLSKPVEPDRLYQVLGELIYEAEKA